MTKHYKNQIKNRTPPAPATYIPQYKLLDIEPTPYPGTTNLRAVATKIPSMPNPTRAPRPMMNLNQVVATLPNSTTGFKYPLPNVGNGTDHLWSRPGQDIIDDFDNVDPNHPMIDNNDYIEPEELKMSPSVISIETNNSTHSVVDNSLQDLSEIVQELVDNAYLLIVEGSPLCSGTLEDVQEQAKALVFGEHEVCDGQPVPVEKITVLKKVPIKIGLFLE